MDAPDTAPTDAACTCHELGQQLRHIDEPRPVAAVAETAAAQTVRQLPWTVPPADDDSEER